MVESGIAAPIGATPRAALGGCGALGAWPGRGNVRETAVDGTVVVKLIENSLTTTNGRAAEPSGVDCSPRAGRAPVLTISACGRALPLSAASRYLAMKASEPIRLRSAFSLPPNLTV